MIHTLVLPNFPIKKKKTPKTKSEKKEKKEKGNRLNFVCISFVYTSRLLVKQCLHPKTPLNYQASSLSFCFSLLYFIKFGVFFLVCNLIINLDSFAYLIRILLSKFCFNLQVVFFLFFFILILSIFNTHTERVKNIF